MDKIDPKDLLVVFNSNRTYIQICCVVLSFELLSLWIQKVSLTKIDFSILEFSPLLPLTFLFFFGIARILWYLTYWLIDLTGVHNGDNQIVSDKTSFTFFLFGGLTLVYGFIIQSYPAFCPFNYQEYSIWFHVYYLFFGALSVLPLFFFVVSDVEFIYENSKNEKNEAPPITKGLKK